MQDGEPHVAPQGVDEVVAADRQGVAVTGDHPDVEVGPGGGQAGGDGRRPAVDRVQPVGVHVVREAGGAADAREEHRVLPPHPEVGHEHLDGGQDRVVPAARAPADLLVAGPVLAGGDGDGGVGHQLSSSRRSARGSAGSRSRRPGRARPAPWSGTGRPPGTRPAPAGDSWPRLTSGTSTCGSGRAPRPGRPGTGSGGPGGRGPPSGPGPAPGAPRRRWPRRSSPSRAPAPSASPVSVVDLEPRGCRRAMPATLAARRWTIRSWLTGS